MRSPEIAETESGPVYARIAQDLEGSILAGEYTPGQRLPTEQSLAKSYAVNRHTASQALNHLQAKGLVYRIRGRGSFVRPGRISYEVAQKMSFSGSVSRAGFSPSKKVVAIRRVRARGPLAEEFGIEADEPLVSLERVGYADKIPLDYGTKHFREKVFPGIYELLHGRWSSARALIERHYGAQMYRYRSTFEVEPADAETARLLGIPPDTSLLRVESLDTLEDGTPAEWGATYFRGDATRVRVNIREAQHESEEDRD